MNVLSTVEEEYVVATKKTKEIIWLQLFIEELGHPQMNLFVHR